MGAPEEDDGRAAVARTARRMVADGLAVGTAGNVSVRAGRGIAITPSGVDADDLDADRIVLVDLGGDVVEGRGRPSSELPLHLAAYRARPDVGAVVHTHSPWATAHAVVGLALPVVHYVLTDLGGGIAVVPFAPPGSEVLARSVAEALRDRHGVLLGGHGAVTVGPDLQRAYARARTLEEVAALHARARALGTPAVLEGAALAEVVAALGGYFDGTGVPSAG